MIPILTSDIVTVKWTWDPEDTVHWNLKKKALAVFSFTVEINSRINKNCRNDFCV